MNPDLDLALDRLIRAPRARPCGGPGPTRPSLSSGEGMAAFT